MRNLALKLAANLKLLEQERGPFKVQCLVCQDTGDVQWELVLWADWFEADERARLDYLLDKLIRPLSGEELMYFSAMITFGPNDSNPFLRSLEKIQKNFDRGLYSTAWHADLIQIPTNLPGAPIVVPLGHQLVEQNREVTELASGVAEVR